MSIGSRKYRVIYSESTAEDLSGDQENNPCDHCENRKTCDEKDPSFSWLLEVGNKDDWLGFMAFISKEEADNLCTTLNLAERDVQEFFSEEDE